MTPNEIDQFAERVAEPEGVGVRFSKVRGSHPSCLLTDVAAPALSVGGMIGLLPSRIWRS
jgi:hypothetical protein